MKYAFGLVRKVNSFLAETTGYLVALLMLLLVFDCISQFVQKQLPGVVELAIFIMIASAYLGLPYTEQNRRHVKVDAILMRLPAAFQKWLTVVWDMLAAIAIFITAYAAYLKAYEAFLDGEAIAGLVEWPLWPIRTVIAISLFWFGVQIVVNLLQGLAKPSEEFIRQG